MNDKFLTAYKGLENELRYENKSVLEYENSLKDTNIQEKLKVCRIIRNYMSHNDMKFVSTTKDMVDFLSAMSNEIRLKSHLVRDEMKKLKCVYKTDTLKSIIPLCSKNKLVPVVDKKTNQIIFVIDSSFLIEQLAKNNKKLELPKKLPKYNYCKKDDRLDKLTGMYIVTDNGTQDGKYLGIICI